MSSKKGREAEPGDDSSSGYNDDEEDSLGSVLNDYNALFYDAPSSLKSTSSSSSSSTSSHDQTKDHDDDVKEKTVIMDQDNDSYSTTRTDNDEGDDEAEYDDRNPMESSVEEACVSDKDQVVDVDKEFEHFLDESDSLMSDSVDLADNNDELDEKSDHNLEHVMQLQDQQRVNLERRAKLQQLESLDLEHLDNNLLKQMAIDKHGLVNRKFRRKLWPLLIKMCSNDSDTSLSNDYDSITQEQIKANVYFNQVTMDVVRTLKRFPPEISSQLRFKLQNQLIDMICKILIRNENLHYYQGYHDICLTFLLVNGANESLPLLESITRSHLTCYMEKTMESTLKLLFNIMPLIDKISSQVAEHIQKAELGVIFSLSWLITWYSHVMENLTIILRLYDFFIASHPLMPVYLGAVIVADRSDEILKIDCDMASLHTVITKFPANINDAEKLEEYIHSALNLFNDYPPDSLADLDVKWKLKCEKLRQEMEEKLRQEVIAEKLRQRKVPKRSSRLKLFGKRTNDNVDGANDSSKKVVSSVLANRVLVGLTISVGLAAMATYAINSKDPNELLSKVFHFMSYKEF